MKKILIKSILCLIVTGLAASAHATTATFDDVTVSPDGAPINNGYAGVNWNNFYELNGVSLNAYYGISASGYANAVVSPNNVAFNYQGLQASITSPSGFSLGSGYFTGAFNNGLSLEIKGYNGNSLLYDQTYTLSTTGPAFISLNMNNLTQATFSSSGGVNAGLNYGTGTQFVMDNLQITPVPEPSSEAVLLIGSIFLLPVLRASTASRHRVSP